MYDLTTLLTTIAAASASFIAILGGFIASKLLSIATERREITAKINDIDEEITYRSKVLKNAEEQNDEEDALDFIWENSQQLWTSNRLELIYRDKGQVPISLDTLQVFWKKAKELYIRFRNEMAISKNLNDDDIPLKLALEIQNDYFSYEVCKKIASDYKKEQRTVKNAGGFNSPIDMIELYEPTRILDDSYRKNNEIIKEQEIAIEWLEIQKKQCERTKEALNKPAGMKSGLVLFGLFAFFCLILPLVFSPFKTDNYSCYLFTKIVFIAIFAIGVLATFIYLIHLLKIKE